MRKNIFSFIGYILITFSFLSFFYPLFVLFSGLDTVSNGIELKRLLMHFIWEGLLPVTIIFLLTFILGKVFLYASKRHNPMTLGKTSVILSAVTLLLLLVLLFIGFFFGDLEGLMGVIMIYFWFIFGPHFIALILLFISWLKDKQYYKDFIFARWEKSLLIIFLLFILTVGLLYFINVGSSAYADSVRSLEVCETEEDLEARNNCYTLLYMYKPELFYASTTDYCQRITGSEEINVDRREHCYESKAYYFKDPALCDLMSHPSARDSCLDTISRL